MGDPRITIGRRSLVLLALLFLILVGCGETSQRTEAPRMSELEQMKYDRMSSQLRTLSAEIAEAEAIGQEDALEHAFRELSRLSYDFNPEQMNESARAICQALKDSVDAYSASPDLILQGGDGGLKTTSSSTRERTLLSRRSMKLNASYRYPFYFLRGDTISLSLSSDGALRVALYDATRESSVRTWGAHEVVGEKIAISSDGIYVLLLQPQEENVRARDVKITCRGEDLMSRPRVVESMTSCRSGDFMAERSDSVRFTPILREPKKVALRGNLKALFSGKARAILSLSVPKGSEELLYSLRVSTNEDVDPSGGDFAHRLTGASNEIRLFGTKVYERKSFNSLFIDRLLSNTRPAREEDAACNMYVFSSSKEAKRFQDQSDGSGNYAYDVDQSQMGTQSCNGRLKAPAGKTLYVGFENERMSYDCYIWFEVVSLSL